MEKLRNLVRLLKSRVRLLADQDTALNKEILTALDNKGAGLPIQLRAALKDAAATRMVFENPDKPPRDFPAADVESIILGIGRPVLLVQNNSFVPTVADVGSEFWTEKLTKAQATLNGVIPSVGRINVTNHPRAQWVGSGWVVRKNVIVTNRHVAEEFATLGAGGAFEFKRHPATNKLIGVSIDFLQEFQGDEERSFRIRKILHIEPAPGPDVAFLEVDPDGKKVPPAVPLGSPVQGQPIAVVGYPGFDPFFPNPELMNQVFHGIYGVKRLAPGYGTTKYAMPKGNGEILEHEASTLGGNSGSAVVDLASGQAVALHFAGLYQDTNYSVSADTVRDLLDQRILK